MTKLIKYLLQTLLFFPLISFSQQVENIRFEQVGKQVHIYYDLHGAETYGVTIYCSEDNGNTWGSPLQEVSGAVGEEIIPGNSKKVVWDVLKEKTKLTGNIKFRIQAESSSVFIDKRDGQEYKKVKIGNQIWMAENLNYKTLYSWCYDNDPAKCKIYGRLYTWDDATKACPSGWHLPSDDEWKILEMALGMSQHEADDTEGRGTDEGKKMKSVSDWNRNGKGTNSIGFNALPGGNRDYGGSFYSLGSYGYWWSSTEHSDTYAWSRYLGYDDDQVYRGYNYEASGRNIRCLKD